MLKLIKQNDESVEPIDLATARLHLRLDTTGSPPSHPDDDLVSALITAVRENAEDYTGLAIAAQTYQLTLDEFPKDKIDLGVWPVRSVTSIQYIDQDGNTQTLAANKYIVDYTDKPATIQYVDPWPQTKIRVNAVTITFTAGFAAGSPTKYNLPTSLKQGMLLMLGHLYENREAVNVGNLVTQVPLGAIHLMTPHRIRMGV